MEEWKTITLKKQSQMTTEYEASNLGRIRNKRTKRDVKPHRHNSGYLMFMYRYKDEYGRVKQTGELWHRVIGRTWISNPDNLPQIDHIDRDFTNNRIDNLRWVSPKQNTANRVPQPKKYSRNRPARTIDRAGNVIKEYATLLEACEEMKVPIAHALEMLHGRRPPKRWGSFQQDLVEKEGKK